MSMQFIHPQTRSHSLPLNYPSVSRADILLGTIFRWFLGVQTRHLAQAARQIPTHRSISPWRGMERFRDQAKSWMGTLHETCPWTSCATIQEREGLPNEIPILGPLTFTLWLNVSSTLSRFQFFFFFFFFETKTLVSDSFWIYIYITFRPGCMYFYSPIHPSPHYWPCRIDRFATRHMPPRYSCLIYFVPSPVHSWKSLHVHRARVHNGHVLAASSPSLRADQCIELETQASSCATILFTFPASLPDASRGTRSLSLLHVPRISVLWFLPSLFPIPSFCLSFPFNLCTLLTSSHSFRQN